MPADYLLAGVGRRVASMIPSRAFPGDVASRFPIVPLDLEHLDALPAPIVTAIFDAGRAAVDEIVVACRSPRLARVPRLVVCSPAQMGALGDALASSDLVVGPLESLEPQDLSRRMHLLADLGAAWLSLELYEQAMREGVTGLTVAERRADQMPLVYASSAFERLTGYAPAEAVGLDCRFLQAANADPVARRTLRSAIGARERAQVVIQNVRKDGTPFWNEVTVFPFCAQGVDLPFTGGVQHDVTELLEARGRVERLMAEQVQRVAFDQAVLDALEVGVMTVDDVGHVTFANDAARAIVGGDQVEGAAVNVALGLRSNPWTLMGDTARHFSHRMRDRDLEITMTRMAGSTLVGLSGLVILRDVTGERALQEEMRRVERLAAIGTMVAGFAHEVRNPVASLRAMAEQLDEDLVEAGLSMPHASRMLKVLGRIETLVDTSLRFGRPATARRAEHRPWQILSSALSAVLPRTRMMGGEIRVEVEPDLPNVYADEGQLVQVLVILLDNALDATQSPRRVALRALSRRGERGSEPPPGLRFEVTDDGPGIPPPVVGRIFDPFFTTKPSGTGLGLSIAQQLVAENGGRIEVTSAPGGPTTFAVSLDPSSPPDSAGRA